MSQIKSLSCVLLLAILIFLGCKTTTQIQNNISLGMSKAQVIKECGQPFKKASRYDKNKNLEEILYYKEKTWDDGGWSWKTTVTNHILVFKNDKLIAIDQNPEEHYEQ